ncbi:uncharacterized protein LOC143025489 [Oratosquilla oratoria]|uniref:uncharacterized protein LOC143025489 n=1 Tax=Oratosquilla oratoria TaxID=337810 RepID=UPI003F76141F
MEVKKCPLVLAVLPLVILAEGSQVLFRFQKELTSPKLSLANLRYLLAQKSVSGELIYTQFPLHPHPNRKESLKKIENIYGCDTKINYGARSSKYPVPLITKSPKIILRKTIGAKESAEKRENKDDDVLRRLNRQKRADSFSRDVHSVQAYDQTNADEDKEGGEEEEEPAEVLPSPEALRWVDPLEMRRQGIILEEVPSLANIFGLRFVRIKNNGRQVVPTQASGANPLTQPWSPSWVRDDPRGSFRNMNIPSRSLSRFLQRVPTTTRRRRLPNRGSYTTSDFPGLTDDEVKELREIGRRYRNHNFEHQQAVSEYPVRSKDEGFWKEIEEKYPPSNGYRSITDVRTPLSLPPNQSSSVPSSQRGQDPVSPYNLDSVWPHRPFIQTQDNEFNLSEDLRNHNNHVMDAGDTGTEKKESGNGEEVGEEEEEEGGGGGIVLPPMTQEDLEKQFPSRNDLYVDELGNIYLKDTENDNPDTKTTADQLETDGYEMYGLDPPEKIHSYDPVKEKIPWPVLEPARLPRRPPHFRKNMGKGAPEPGTNDFTKYQENYIFLQGRPRSPPLPVDLPKENNYQTPPPTRFQVPTSTHRLRGKPLYSSRPLLARPPLSSPPPPPPRVPLIVPPAPGTRIIVPNNFVPPDTRLIARPVPRPQHQAPAPVTFTHHPQLYEDEIKYPHRLELQNNYQQHRTSSRGRPASGYSHFQEDTVNRNPYYPESRPPAPSRGTHGSSGFYPGNGFFDVDLQTVFRMPSTYDNGLRATNKLG